MRKFIISITLFALLAVGVTEYVLYYFMSRSMTDSLVEASPAHVVYKDPVKDAIMAIQQKGKLVVADNTVRTETTGYLDSSIWDASVKSSATYRFQVYLDLEAFRPDWAKRSGNDIVITIPQKYIQVDLIHVDTSNEDNGSLVFSLRSKYRTDLIDQNRIRLDQQSTALAATIRAQNAHLVTEQMRKLFTVALTDTPYRVIVNIDG